VRRIGLVAVLWCVATLSLADTLEVRRSANIYSEPGRGSDVLLHIDPAAEAAPYLLTLTESDKTNGYYHVRLRGQTTQGWIYKTLVRRYAGPHPDYIRYKRSLYRHWVDDDGDCQNTRAEVLIRDDDDHRVQFKTSRHCVVKSGTWLDPYTSSTFTSAGKIDVDHVVPLKNAHESGGWAWSNDKRRRYANFIDSPGHLLAVSATENRRKGAKGPDQYLPPNADYHCEYVALWIRIKRDWELEMTEAEGVAVQRVQDRCAQ